MDFLNRWSVTMASGGRPVLFPGALSFPALASADGKNSIVILTHQLRIYFLATRQCIRTVDVELRDVVAAHLDPQNPAQIIVFTASGKVLYINWKEKVDQPVVAQQDLNIPVHEVFRVDEHNYYVIEKEGSAIRVHRVDRETAEPALVFEASGTAHAVSRGGSKLAVAGESTVLYDISSLYAGGSQAGVDATKESWKATTKDAVMAVSDTGIVAVGSPGGVIFLYHGSGSKYSSGLENSAAKSGTKTPAKAVGAPTTEALSTRTLRWHVDPVRSLLFSGDGAYLVSGGGEKVLVFWHLLLERTQFLPRLSGSIDRIFVDSNRPDHYAIALGGETDEIVVMLALDLVSRLSVAPPRPNFALSRWAKKLAHSVEKQALEKDITAPVAVHPTSRHLYFARGAAIQAFDLVRGEQAFVQHAAPQLATGRVKLEHQIPDPAVLSVAFSADGRWMATFDSMPALDFDNLLSKGDTSHALKFWHQVDGQWALALKIVDPHGGLAVGAVVAAPAGAAFATVDERGGLRVWRPRGDQAEGEAAVEIAAQAAKNGKVASTPVWTLRRATPPSGVSAPVAACFAPDGSLLVVAHGTTLRAFDPALLLPVEFRLPALDLAIRFVAIAGSHLVFALHSRVVVFDLVAGREKMCARFDAAGSSNLVAVDQARELVAVAANYYSENHIHCKIVLLRLNSLEPVHSIVHKQAVAAVRATSSGFVFVDVDSRIGVLAPSARSIAEVDDLATQMHAMLLGAQAAANLLYSRTITEGGAKEEDTEKWNSHRLLDVAQLLPVFQNVDGVPMDALFERLVRAIQ